MKQSGPSAEDVGNLRVARRHPNGQARHFQQRVEACLRNLATACQGPSFREAAWRLNIPEKLVRWRALGNTARTTATCVAIGNKGQGAQMERTEMIKLEATFYCVCPVAECERQLDAANWDTALAEVRLMHCRNQGQERFVVCNLTLTEYDGRGCLADVDELTWEWRKAG